MKRRNFLKVSSAVAVSAVMMPASLSAINFRKTKPKAWSIPNDMKVSGIDLKGTNAAIKEIFGTTKTIEGSIKMKAPKIAENGAIIPISFKTKLKAKTIAVLQSANTEPLVAIFDIHKRSIPDYTMRTRMQKTATVTVVVQTIDGKLYKTTKDVTVTLGGCGG
jgi:sulfur-oxidizing protein SoxY